MTRRKSDPTSTRKSNRSASASPSSVDVMQWLLQREVWGLILTAIGAVTLISLLSNSQGQLSRAWSLMLRQTFGLGAYPVAALLLGSGIVVLLWNLVQERFDPRWQTIIGSELLFFAALGLLHVTSGDPPLELARAGKRGGYLGWAIYQLLVPILGRPISILLLALLVVAAALLATGISWRTAIWRLRWIVAQVALRVRTEIARRRALAPARAPAAAGEPGFLNPPISTGAEPGSKAASRTSPLGKDKAGRTRPRRDTPARPLSTPAGLPPLDLLTLEQPGSNDEADARLKAQIIEDTLEAFGIPARVAEWHRGPVVTQFGVEPGYIERLDREGKPRRYKVRVSKILSLTNDLALALAAAQIRIEAPVPGRPLVGIEVPNDTKAVVGLRGVLESDPFRKMRGPLRIALGRGVSGEAVVADLTAMPHLLLAGATGSGKSVCLNAIIASLLFYNTPEQLRLLLIDPKRVEMTKYNGIPHLLAPVVVDIEKVIVALRWITREMDRRYTRFAEAGARNVETYNHMAGSKSLDPMPMVVVVIDELADLMLVAPDDVERAICRLAQMSRATGIHLVIATQRPSVDVVTGLIKANFPARLSFAVTSQVDSRVILDTPGAEKLLGRGDMLYMAPDSPQLQRIQGCFVSDKELEALSAYWRRQVLESMVQGDLPAPWEGMSLHEEDEEDDLLDQAAELVRKHGQASASFLQRQMRIGYPRAARLMDQLEEHNVVGPPEMGGRSRAVLLDEDDNDDEAEDADDYVEEEAGEA
jgi:DNA segregation ATPase FtsK/SpoIIIE, S-DNA-T family